ncbi:MAG: YifB family Mg chelatase-like AAA ATPase, partial [Salinisphaeraceae bacterium]|nr:YifB family Mg chelatase-like AAA ATPase [Salinisphaeraceae bacterium]
MSLATVFSRAQCGLDAPLVRVEVHMGNGLSALSLVGLPEAAVKESKDRVRAALLTSGYQFPARRITVNLAPADLPKDGARFDLAIALAILAASGQLVCEDLLRYEFLGELSLGAELRAVRGALPAALASGKENRVLLTPSANGFEAALASQCSVRTANSLLEVTAALSGQAELPQATKPDVCVKETAPDLRDVRGQHQARRALEIAAAGGHSLLMQGPPGSGKSMLATRLPGILPPLSENEALEVAAVQSISRAGFDVTQHWGRRPFRSPHHTASGVALVGGGGNPRPGEITLAHHGVLFLDELPEFDRRVLEVLREPLESGQITISRAALQAEFPSRFQLVAAMNPCPCGYLGDPSGRCHCTAEQVQRYASRISGPLLDRIDLQLRVPRVRQEELLAKDAPVAESSARVRARVVQARERQQTRAAKPNAQLGV